MKKLLFIFAFFLIVSSVAHASIVSVDLPGIRWPGDYAFQKSWVFPQDTLTSLYNVQGNPPGSFQNPSPRISQVSQSASTMALPPASPKTLTKGGALGSFTPGRPGGKDSTAQGTRTSPRVGSGPGLDHQVPDSLPLFSMSIFLLFGFLGLYLLGLRRKRV
jgi:hypothetical protein